MAEMQKVAELYFEPGGIRPQTLALASEDQGLTAESPRTEPVAVTTWCRTVGRVDERGFSTGFPDIPEGEEWPLIWPQASRDGVFDAYWLLEKVALSRYRASWNKAVAIATLNTWFWVGVVGMNGVLRTQFRIRHTLPTGEPARWELWSDGSKFELRIPQSVREEEIVEEVQS